MFVRWKRRERMSLNPHKRREDRSPRWWRKKKRGTGRLQLTAR
jgi:hypothetical protein